MNPNVQPGSAFFFNPEPSIIEKRSRIRPNIRFRIRNIIEKLRMIMIISLVEPVEPWAYRGGELGQRIQRSLGQTHSGLDIS